MTACAPFQTIRALNCTVPLKSMSFLQSPILWMLAWFVFIWHRSNTFGSRNCLCFPDIVNLCFTKNTLSSINTYPRMIYLLWGNFGEFLSTFPFCFKAKFIVLIRKSFHYRKYLKKKNINGKYTKYKRKEAMTKIKKDVSYLEVVSLEILCS